MNDRLGRKGETLKPMLEVMILSLEKKNSQCTFFILDFPQFGLFRGSKTFIVSPQFGEWWCRG